MGDTYAIPALIRKRAELAGLVEQTQAELSRLRIALGHVEATLRLFDPDMDVEALPVPRPAFPPLLRGMNRRALDLLRTSAEPLTTWELAKRVVEDASLPQAQIPRVDKAVSNLMRRNEGKLVERENGKRPSRWRVV